MPEFHFMESDWGIHAKRGGSICTATSLACTVVGFIFWHWFGAVLSLAIGLVLATFEVPFVYKCFEPCRRLETILNDTLKFSIPAVRAVLYLCLAIVAFTSNSLNIVLGVLLLLTAILYAFAQIVGSAITDTSTVPSDAAPADGQTPFGTFT
ncbi:unnamed protein product [Ectocarpus sp. 12 AP-2014]